MLGSINPFRRAMAAEAPVEVDTDVDHDGELADMPGDLAITLAEETYRRRVNLQPYESWTCTSINPEKDGGNISKLHFFLHQGPVRRSC